MANVSLQNRDGKFFLAGDLSFDSVGVLVDEQLYSNGDVIVNLSEVNYSDSSGLALLINWYREAKKRSINMSFEAVPQKMMALAKVSNLDKVLPIV